MFVECSVPIELLNELIGENVTEILRDRARFGFEVAYLSEDACEYTLGNSQFLSFTSDVAYLSLDSSSSSMLSNSSLLFSGNPKL